MLRASITFLILAVVAAALGFSGVAGTAAITAQILFYVFLVLFALGLLAGRRLRI